jgi:hypothetical protein
MAPTYAKMLHQEMSEATVPGCGLSKAVDVELAREAGAAANIQLGAGV